MKQLSFLAHDLIDHYQVSWEDKLFSFTTTNGRVSAAPPIAGWALGQKLKPVIAWYAKRGATVTKIGDRDDQPEPSGTHSHGGV